MAKARTARSRRRESWEKQPSHHSEEAGGKRAAGTAGAGQNHTQEALNRRQGGHGTGKRAPLSHPLPSEGWVWAGGVANAALLPQQSPELHGDSSSPHCSHRRRNGRGVEEWPGLSLHPSRAARPSPCKPERFSQSCAVMAGMWGLARAGQAAQRLLSHGLQQRLCPLPSPVPPPQRADKDDPALRARTGSIPAPATSCSPSRPILQHTLVHSSSVKSSNLSNPSPLLLRLCSPKPPSRVSHGGTAATEPSHGGWMFSKCFGGRPQHVPPSGHCHSVICLHQ